MLPYKRYRSTAQRSIEEAKTARYKNSAKGFDSGFPGFFRGEQQSPTPHVDTTSDAHQVQNRRRSLLQEMQPLAADRCLELAVDYLSPNGCVVCCTSSCSSENDIHVPIADDTEAVEHFVRKLIDDSPHVSLKVL